MCIYCIPACVPCEVNLFQIVAGRIMPSAQAAKTTDSKGTYTTFNKRNRQKVAGSRKLKQEVQTIIDIMGPPLCSNFNYNTSSEADNEESVFSNSKLSSSENTDWSAKNKDNLSIAVDLNSSTSAILDELTDSQANFPYVESVYSNTQYICPPPSNPANICINSECFCPQVASLLHGRKNHNGIHASCKHELATPKCGNLEPNDDRSLELNKDSKNVVINWLKAMILSSKELNDANCAEYYRMNVTKQRGNNNSRPRRAVFELVKNAPFKNVQDCGISNPDDVIVSKSKKNCKNQRMQTRVELRPTNLRPVSQTPRKPIEKTTHCDSSGKTRVDLYYFDNGSYK
ncbi:hypothetical protein HUJ05_002097 [Dendroctonus ponderosae]|nr:hypothetical protein HUJ05_002097 [Dendroctonus ponderosae]